jgi:ABC-type molybdate transport system substrate-binding protein
MPHVRCLFVALLLLEAAAPVGAQQPITLYAAGSLKAALGEVAGNYQATYGTPVATTFGPSGLLRERIEKGEPAQVFASANMKHPAALEAEGRGGPIVLFARNKLCALARDAVDVTTETLLDVLLDPSVRLGTSTPKADPSGDYAWQLFAKADTVRPGARAALEAKALQLTGGATSEKAPDGRNPYGWVMESNKADIFLTYCTNAVTPEVLSQVYGVPVTVERLDTGTTFASSWVSSDDRRRAYSTPTMTSLALMITETSLPGVRPRRSAELTVMVEVITLPPPMSTWISAATAPLVTLVTLPLRMLRALSFMFSSSCRRSQGPLKWTRPNAVAS